MWYDDALSSLEYVNGFISKILIQIPSVFRSDRKRSFLVSMIFDIEGIPYITVESDATCMYCGEELTVAEKEIELTCIECGETVRDSIYCHSNHYICKQCYSAWFDDFSNILFETIAKGSKTISETVKSHLIGKLEEIYNEQFDSSNYIEGIKRLEREDADRYYRVMGFISRKMGHELSKVWSVEFKQKYGVNTEVTAFLSLITLLLNNFVKNHCEKCNNNNCNGKYLVEMLNRG